jgi:hypothetical protein
MAQLQMQNQQIVNDSLIAKQHSDQSLANEREAKGRLEQVQIETAYNKSEHEKSSATLNMMKAAHEVQSMKIEDFVKVFSLIESIQKRQDDNVIKKQEIQNSQEVTSGT